MSNYNNNIKYIRFQKSMHSNNNKEGNFFFTHYITKINIDSIKTKDDFFVLLTDMINNFYEYKLKQEINYHSPRIYNYQFEGISLDLYKIQSEKNGTISIASFIIIFEFLLEHFRLKNNNEFINDINNIRSVFFNIFKEIEKNSETMPLISSYFIKDIFDECKDIDFNTISEEEKKNKIKEITQKYLSPDIYYITALSSNLIKYLNYQQKIKFLDKDSDLDQIIDEYKKSTYYYYEDFIKSYDINYIIEALNNDLKSNEAIKIEESNIRDKAFKDIKETLKEFFHSNPNNIINIACNEYNSDNVFLSILYDKNNEIGVENEISLNYFNKKSHNIYYLDEKSYDIYVKNCERKDLKELNKSNKEKIKSFFNDPKNQPKIDHFYKVDDSERNANEENCMPNIKERLNIEKFQKDDKGIFDYIEESFKFIYSSIKAILDFFTNLVSLLIPSSSVDLKETSQGITNTTINK